MVSTSNTLYFKTTEFYKSGTYIPSVVDYKILNIIRALHPIREELGAPIIISKRSGYRPKSRELAKGRSGNSQHCFEGKGAVDLTCSPEKFQELYRLLVEESIFTRICLYPDKRFIHCDFKESGHRLYLDTGNGWERIS